MICFSPPPRRRQGEKWGGGLFTFKSPNQHNQHNQHNTRYGNRAIDNVTGSYIDGRTLLSDLTFLVGMGKVLPRWRKSITALASRSSYFWTNTAMRVGEPTYLEQFGNDFTVGLLWGRGGVDADPGIRENVGRDQQRGGVVYSCELLDDSCNENLRAHGEVLLGKKGPFLFMQRIHYAAGDFQGANFGRKTLLGSFGIVVPTANLSRTDTSGYVLPTQGSLQLLLNMNGVIVATPPLTTMQTVVGPHAAGLEDVGSHVNFEHDKFGGTSVFDNIKQQPTGEWSAIMDEVNSSALGQSHSGSRDFLIDRSGVSTPHFLAFYKWACRANSAALPPLNMSLNAP